jgi:hypothetical protein
MNTSRDVLHTAVTRLLLSSVGCIIRPLQLYLPYSSFTIRFVHVRCPSAESQIVFLGQIKFGKSHEASPV